MLKTFALLAAASVVALVSVSIAYSKVKSDNYHLTHTLISCEGSYLLFQGNKDQALRFAGKVCPLNYEIVPNQEYDDTIH